MTARRSDIADLPYWPRLLSLEQAAAYLGVSPPTFLEHVTVRSSTIGKRRLWDRLALDRWVDGGAAPAEQSPGEKWLGIYRDHDPHAA